MSVRTLKPVLATGAAVLLLAAGAFLAGSDLHAQGDEGAQVVVGTYNPQQVAQAMGLQQQMMQEMQALQQRAQEAQQSGDQQAMQEIQAEAQQIQQETADRFMADVEGVMAQVAESTGASIIATEVTYTGPGVTTQDVTQAVIEALGGAAPAPEQPSEPGE